MNALKLAVLTVILGLGPLGGGAGATPEVRRIRAQDIADYLKSLGPWVDWQRTCDTFKTGDPKREIEAVAVSWMSTLDALKKANALGCQMFITHEPTFYSHMDDDPSFDEDKATVEKRKLLADTGMVVYRCHDVWDRVPEMGILASWARTLGFEGKPVLERGFYAVYEIPETTVEALARDVAGRLTRFGQEAVQAAGDLKSKVRRLAIGTGAITEPREMQALGADAAVVTEIVYWQEVSWAKDMGFPLIIVSHSVSECPGIENLAAHLRQKFSGVRVEYIEEGCPFSLIGPSGRLK